MLNSPNIINIKALCHTTTTLHRVLNDLGYYNTTTDYNWNV